MTLLILTFPLTSRPLNSLLPLCLYRLLFRCHWGGGSPFLVGISLSPARLISKLTYSGSCIRYQVPGTCSAVSFRGTKVSEVTFEYVHPKPYPVLRWKCHILFSCWIFVLTLLTTIFAFSPVVCRAWCLIAVHCWPCFNFWPHCNVLFFFQSYCSSGSSRYLTRPRAALHIERKSFRL